MSLFYVTVGQVLATAVHTMSLFYVTVGQVLASTVQAEQEDVDLAVVSARKAFESWGSSSGHYRARILYRSLLYLLFSLYYSVISVLYCAVF